MCVFYQPWQNNRGSPLRRPAVIRQATVPDWPKEEIMTAGPIKAFARGAALAVLLIAACGVSARAGEIRLLSAAAMQSVFKNIAGEFERTSGHKLTISYGTIGGIAQRIQGGETADLVIGSILSMPALVKEGKIDGASLVTICTTGIGMVVP